MCVNIYKSQKLKLTRNWSTVDRGFSFSKWLSKDISYGKFYSSMIKTYNLYLFTHLFLRPGCLQLTHSPQGTAEQNSQVDTWHTKRFLEKGYRTYFQNKLIAQIRNYSIIPTPK